MPLMMEEPLTCVRTGLNSELATRLPKNQATMSSDSALTNVPPTASAVRAFMPVTRLRRTAPSDEATSCPRVAARKAITMASSACWAAPSTAASAIGGAISTPMTPPPTKPTKLSRLTMKPCR